jgi:hypothetical protein
MQKGLRRKLLTLYADAFRTRPYFKSVLLHQPFLPFPIAEKLPGILIPVMPSDLRDETSNDRQNDFRISPTVIVWSSSAGDELDLLKCDAADQVEEALITLGRSTSFQSEFSQLRVDRVDPTPLALMPWGIPAVAIIPPYGAIRFDTVVDFHYAGVTV